MSVFVNIATLFVIGSMIGYVLEIFYRRFVSAKKWVNPGFLVGPYIPIYGFGALILFGISCIYIPVRHLPNWAIILIEILVIGVSLTLIELIGGLIFIKGFHLKLWDYSKRWLNYKGVICPLFSLIWALVGSLYIFHIQPYLLMALDFINKNLIYSFFVGLVIGMMIVDTAYSLHLGFKLRNATTGFNLKFEQFKIDAKEKRKELVKKKPLLGFFIETLSIDELKELINFSFKKNLDTKVKKKKKNNDDNKSSDTTDEKQNLENKIENQDK